MTAGNRRSKRIIEQTISYVESKNVLLEEPEATKKTTKKPRESTKTKTDENKKNSIPKAKKASSIPKSIIAPIIENQKLTVIVDGISSETIFAEAMKHFTKNDSKLIELIGKCPKPRFFVEGKSETSAFESLAKSIISQQISRSAALSVFTKLKVNFGVRIKGLDDKNFKTTTVLQDDFEAKNKDDYIISPDSILKHDPEELRTAGLSSRKVEYMMSLANYFKSKGISDSTFNTMSNDEISAALIEIKGIGQWTIDMFLIFYLARLDVMPTLDLEVKKAMCRHFNKPFTKKTPTSEELIELSQIWAPYRSIACWYMYQQRDYAP
ncbi:DNA-3-methyladenine glycosylase 1 [Smittium culicis]|uniref:DNA-3-methyladenine glycosylase 1 n=2 Tax=Smittium culicis TaxID=133412 RepID=A0A1R1XB94_9FUNG|nr:DNA-3-methyladenine glycosylase 1 [Smittium culicis]OMJ14506.1 DNA-3-methyladenine glycosylase 1 [Smittium culicis]